MSWFFLCVCMCVSFPLFPPFSHCFLILHTRIPLGLVSLLSHSLRGFSYHSCAIGTRAGTHTHNYKRKKKNSRNTRIYKRNYNSLPQDLTEADVCLTSVPREIVGKRLVKISHMFSLLPLFPCLFSFCLCRSINVREPSLMQSPQKPCFWLSLLWARYRGLTQGSEIGKKNKKQSSQLNVQRDALVHKAQTHREIMQLVVSTWKSLHFILLIEPPACTYLSTRTSLSGPNRPTAAAAKNPQQSGLANQGPNPSAWGQGRGRWD